ncbi:glycosyltransferase family 4 protein [Bacillus alveayuensis]|uniref:glycosyltransferase family 4 protein n=1 Tax=Aeribacillus alveayuensis TaxID=279215 RepID=UPI0005CD324B|nr:glycosyltransferase family 4 protein [Bacillus alveayuensis]
MNKKRVAIFRPGVISNGSAFEAMASIYKYIQKKYGWEFVVIKDEQDNYFDEEFDIITIPSASRKTIPLVSFPRSYILFKKYVEYVLKDFDIILSSDPTIYDQGVLAAFVANKYKIPLVYDASLTTMGQSKGLKWKIRKRIAKWALYKSQIIWLTVPKTAERFRDIGLSDPRISSQFVLMGHPVDINTFKPDEKMKNNDTKIILCVARLVLEKGVQYIIEAVAPILKNNSNVKLLIVGKGEAKPFLERIAIEEGISDKIEFIDPVPHKDLIKIYQSAHIFIGHPISISTWEEYFGVVNIEAMACGLPLVSSRSGGISYLIREDEVACLVEERDIIGITKSLKRLLFDQTFYKKLSENGRKYVCNKYSVEVIAEKYKYYLDKLLDKGE